MNEGDARFIRVSIGMLARQLKELVACVAVLNDILKTGADSATARPVIEELEEQLLELEASVSSVAEAFPGEYPGGRNGG